jgi:hypothetical protein
MNHWTRRLALLASSLAMGAAGISAAQAPPATATPDAPANTAAPAAAAAHAPKKHANAQAEAGEPRAATSAPVGPDAGVRKGKNAADRVDLDTTTVTGNRELPKVMYVVPWKRSDIGDLIGRPANSLLDEVLAPVDRNVFRREIQYYQALKPDAAPAAPQVEK